MSTTTVILTGSPYGSESVYNILRLVPPLLNRGEQVRIHLVGDAVDCARAGQEPPQGFYNIERMLAGLIERGVAVTI
ncbi:MAG: hypothetical protein C4521_10200 [Actinobacteria bacterium]|nr:MAG: hypothetical protein C4521_10200 [Actinomycetota bacterium]